MPIWLWIVVGYLCGSIPFSLWIGRLATGRDIRTVGDHNPGATNVWRAGSKPAAALALLLDMVKGALPVGLACHQAGIASAWLFPIALAPVLGHATSPFLGGRGGKAVAVSGGIWAGLTAWEGPLIGGLGVSLGTYGLGANGWAVMSAMVLLLLYLGFTPTAWNGWIIRPPRALMIAIWIGNTAILAWKHRADLRSRPRLRAVRQPRGDV